MKFYKIEPEVPGGFGNNAIINYRDHPPRVKKLHIEFDGWLEDDILESFPCYIITERLKKELEKTSISGCEFDEVEISKSNEFKNLFPKTRLPKFVWLKVNGKPGKDDLGLLYPARLVVSGRVLNVLRSFNLNHCDIEEYC